MAPVRTNGVSSGQERETINQHPMVCLRTRAHCHVPLRIDVFSCVLIVWLLSGSRNRNGATVRVDREELMAVHCPRMAGPDTGSGINEEQPRDDIPLPRPALIPNVPLPDKLVHVFCICQGVGEGTRDRERTRAGFGGGVLVWIEGWTGRVGLDLAPVPEVARSWCLWGRVP